MPKFKFIADPDERRDHNIKVVRHHLALALDAMGDVYDEWDAEVDNIYEAMEAELADLSSVKVEGWSDGFINMATGVDTPPPVGPIPALASGPRLN